MDIKNQTAYFNERIKPYHVKTRNVATIANVWETTTVHTKEHISIIETVYDHDVVLIDTTIGYDAGSYDGTYNSIIFKKNASFISVYVDNLLLGTSNWDDGFWNGLTFNNAPVDDICNAVELSSPYGTNKDIWIIGLYATTFDLAVNQSKQILWFNDSNGSNPSSNVLFNNNSNAVDITVSTGEHLQFIEGFFNGLVFNPNPVDGICNAVELLFPIYNDESSISITLRNRFAVFRTLSAGNTVVEFTGDARIAYDWPNVNSPGPNDFFFSMIVVNDSAPPLSVTEIINLP